ncbi:hypothetical protein FRB90_012137 [Tulasnella sp. 427]|nr:hypothetical protein FRB90_012137 [Tulasnella sp. 427]
MDSIDQQPTAGSSSSAPLPTAIYTNRTSSAPLLPTPEVDGTSFLESVLSRTSFSDDGVDDKKLESKKASLDKELAELQELQKRLEQAEARRVALEKRMSLPGKSVNVNTSVSAGGGR